MNWLSRSRLVVIGAGGMTLVAAGFFIVKAQVNPFGQPTNFKATAISACEIDLSWDAQQAASFEIQRSTDGTFFSGVTTITAPGDSVLWKDAQLPTSTPFYYQMRAKSSTRQSSPWSDPANASTLPLPAPGAPTITSGVGISGNKQITLSFTAPVALSDFGGFFVERAMFGNNNFAVLNAGNPLPSSFTSFSDNDGGTNLNPANVYQYRIRSLESGKGCGDVKAYSPYSGVVVVPTAPSNLSASFSYNPTKANDTVELSWTGSKGQDFYEVWRGTGSASMAFFVKASGAPYSDSNTQANTKYFYKIRACTNSGGCSDFSNEDSRTVASAPQRLIATIAAMHSGTPGTADIALSWDNTFPERNYYLERATSTTGTFVQAGGAIAGKSASEPSMSHQDSGLPTGYTYFYRVRSKFGTNFTNYSNLASVDTNVTPLSGWAWAAADGSGGVPHGIGWIKFDSETTPADSISYGVYRNASNVLSGYAWSGIKCAAGENRPASSTCGYGWLSFNETSGCPGGSCAATFDPATNKLSGWAKFTAADPTKGSWDGWVSLNSLNMGNEPAYAVEYSSSTGKFVPGTTGNTSWAWGSNVTGWMTFYDVSMGAVAVGTEVISNLKATALDCVNANNCPVRLEWTNPRTFNKVRLFERPDNNPCSGMTGSALTTCRDANFNEFRTDLPLASGTQSYIVENLKPKSTHNLFIRGTY